MKKHGLWLIVAFACLTLFAFLTHHRKSCLNNTCPPSLVRPPENPLRIVSLAPNITEILFALGLDEKIIAVSSDSDYPPQTESKQKTGTFWQPNTEAIIAAKPDLIITEQIERQNAVAETLNNLGYPVLTLKIEKIPELFTAIEQIGKAAGCDQQAQQLVETINLKLNQLKEKFHSAEKVRVLWVVQTEPLRIVGRDTFVNDLIEIAGGENAIGPTIQYYPPVSTEEIIACRADVIIHSAMDATDLTQQQKDAEAFWAKIPNLPAVKNKRIHVIKADTTLRLGPRLPKGVEIIANLLHPQLETEKKQVGD